MLLSIRNLGKIETADIEINGITVIVGENNSGKSTVGKALFCVFNSFYDIGGQIDAERTELISRAISRNTTDLLMFPSFLSSPSFNLHELSKTIIENKDRYINDKNLLRQNLDNLPTQKSMLVDSTRFDEAVDKILSYLDVSEKDILVLVLQKKLQAEFNMQVNNLYHPERNSEIVLKIKNSEIKTKISGNINVDITGHISLSTEAIYIDDPYILDNLRPISGYRDFTHREHLHTCLTTKKDSLLLEEIITTKRLGSAFGKLNSVCSGEMINKAGRSFAYRENGSPVSFNMLNVSTGLKAFLIIKTLLLNGWLEENGTIILDEPEKHLHPEWQLIFAELIVLLQKEFKMHILINTHSHYFLDAIGTYSWKHGTAEKCKYYLADNSGITSTISDISDDLEKIYQRYANPLQVLENERYADD